MDKFIGYGFTTSPDKKDSIDVTKTQAYKKLQGMFVADIVIDVINSHTRKRKRLEELITTMEPWDIIVLHSIDALGKPNEAAKYYKKIIERQNLGLLIADYSAPSSLSKFSLVDFSGKWLYAENQMKKLSDELFEFLTERNKTSFNRGVLRQKMVNETFKDIYWKYEGYELKETTTLEMLGMTKVTFRKLCSEYEDSQDYFKDLHMNNVRYDLDEKPKRYGKIPDKFEELVKKVDIGIPLHIACSEVGIAEMSEIQYKRYLLKWTGVKPKKGTK